MLTMSGNEHDWLALKPQEPSPSQCCGSGCKPCIYDVYEKELAQWERAKAKQDKSLLMEKKEQSNNSELNPDTFTAFSISSVEQLTEDTYQYKFELPGNSSLRLSLGQHIVLRGVVNGLEVQRAYTPIRNAEGYFEVLMKCYEAGLMSQYIKTWKKGDMVFWRGPFGGFPYRPNKVLPGLVYSATTLAVNWRKYTLLNCRIFKKEEEREVDRRLENTSRVLCSSLALEVPGAFNKWNVLCSSHECGSVFALFEPHCFFVTEHKPEGELLIFFSLGYSLNCSSSSEVSHHPATLQMLIPPADTRLAAKKSRSSFRGRLLTHTNLVT
ncbi:NADH-cytochrome b5 reductase-like isoform X1 [Falco naumanni]|uniref:NADH-cytochrome b5 reductase-like isoform X1 n=2 Tax=Falco naumanni TaxID=148594 RepID=UPI001ADE1978|nr:NADH-cytochrome b5 reductase-like isoform X1 [Falco naumanni]